MVKVRRKWTLQQKQKIVAFANRYSTALAGERFEVHDTQVRRWQRGEQMGTSGKRGPTKASLVAKEFGHTGNGSEPPDAGRLQRKLKIALTHLERWKEGQRAHIRRGMVDNAYDLEAEHAYRTLRGEE